MSILKVLIKALITLPSKILISVFFFYEHIIHRASPKLYGLLRHDFNNVVDNDIKEVFYNHSGKLTKFKIYTPNRMCAFRHRTFSSKEPEILEWINEFGSCGSFYDIGANIGIYSLYYAKTQQGKVFSFEPSAFNMRQLAKNISINNLTNRIIIVSNPLSNQTGEAVFINGNSDEGGSSSAFGVNFGFDGNPIDSEVEYSLIGFTLDDLFKTNVIKSEPGLIKIDVDGIEHLILEGAENILASKNLKSIFIEINDNFNDQSMNAKRILKQHGFELREKRQSEITKRTKEYCQTFNQIWVR